jgi:hypothetical protein
MKPDIIDQITEIWNTKGLFESSEHLNKLLYSASTGTELVIILKTYFFDLKVNRKTEYEVAKKEINKFLRMY